MPTLPSFLRFTDSYLNNYTENKAKVQLIHSISELYVKGVSYSEILNKKGKFFKPILIAWTKIERKYDLHSYSSVQKLITMVYTRDEVITPFGPWKKFEYFAPLLFLKMAIELKNESDGNYSQMNMAGVLFALWIFLRNLEGNYNTDGYSIRKPNRLYFTAGIDSQSFSTYSRVLSEKWRISIESTIGSTRIPNANPVTVIKIKQFKPLLDYINAYLIEHRTMSGVLTSIYDEGTKCRSGIVLNEYDSRFDKTWGKIQSIYETKYMRDKYAKFHYRPLEGNPFLRIFIEDEMYFITSQLHLINYKLVFYSLYTDVHHLKTEHRIKHLTKYLGSNYSNTITRLKLFDFSSSIEKLKTILTNGGIFKKKRMISQPGRFNFRGKHFNQIVKCIPYIQELKVRGIPIKLTGSTYSFHKSNQVRFKLDQLINLTDSILESDLNFVADNLKNKDRVNNSKDWVIKIEENLFGNMRNDGRIFGYFTPHGAATHRMSCSKLNLHGIPKFLREEMFSPSSGKVFLSADVSGQDIVVAANLANKLLYDKRIIRLTDKSNINLLRSGIKNTLDKLSTEPTNKPTDYLTTVIKNDIVSLDNRLRFLKSVNDKELKNLIKQCVYINFYGGSGNNFRKQLKRNERVILVDLIYSYLNPILENVLPQNKFPQIDESEKSRKKLKPLIKKLTSIKAELEKNLESENDKEECKQIIQIINKIQIRYELFNNIQNSAQYFYSKVIKSISEVYPGIIESLELLELYTNKSKLSMSYPSLLGWQTVVEKLDVFMRYKTINRAKSYPIQSSGAEFIRQWFMETSKLKGYGRDFYIVNVIHDQLLLEVKSDKVESLKMHLNRTLKSAAKKVDIDPKSIQADPINLYNRFHLK